MRAPDRMAPLPPSPPLPRSAQTLLWSMAPFRFLSACHRRYGSPFRLRTAGAGDIVMVTSPQEIRDVFTGDPDVFHAGELSATFLTPLVGRRSLFVLDGRAHLRERKLILPPFHGARMQAFGERMRAATEASVRHWPADTPFAILPLLREIALEVILGAVFGVEDADRLASLKPTIARLLDGSTSPWLLLASLAGWDLFELMPWHPTARLKVRMDRAIHEHIAERRRAPAGADVLSVLLAGRDEDGQPLDDEHLRDELVTFLLAGHETTASAMAWTLLHLLADPPALAAVVDELDGGGHELLDAAIKESLRLRPVLNVVGRKLKADASIGGWELPAGTTVAPCVHLVHRRPDLYPDPDRFVLERFLHTRPEPFAWLPFGGGSRRCVGMGFALFEMRVVLSEILARVSLTLPRGRVEGPRQRGLTVTPRRGGEVVLVARRHKTHCGPRHADAA